MSRSRSPVAQSQSRSPSPDPRSQARSRSRSPAREREPEAVNHGNTLYITGLSSRVTDKELREYFNKEGKVVSCHVVLEPHTRVSRGFAFITMDTVEDAERCIKYLNQSELLGRNITVEKVIVCASTWVVVLLVQMYRSLLFMCVDLEVFWWLFRRHCALCKLCASNQDAEFINFNFSSYSLINGQPKGLLWNTRFTTTKRSKFSTKPEHSPSTPHQLINGHFQHFSQDVW
ncbi:putative RNA-binding protein [Hordeum vulgare]|nr:putative RNA-binding protein [Hordeum vulgare]